MRSINIQSSRQRGKFRQSALELDVSEYNEDAVFEFRTRYVSLRVRSLFRYLGKFKNTVHLVLQSRLLELQLSFFSTLT